MDNQREKELSEFINGVAHDANDLQLSPEEYCIIVYQTSSRDESLGHVRFIYKTLQDFIDKFPNDQRKIPKSSGVSVQIWVYD